MDNWFHHDHHGRRGRSQRYTDQTICTSPLAEKISLRNYKVKWEK